MSLETRSNSALMKRAEQLKRWQDSETFREPGDLKRKKRRIGFSDGCVFLAACAAGDKEEVKNLISRGTDIDTANVDGLTALHQACIDDNLDMVEFLVALGADVNRGDNEGWTPLHATASCGFLSIAKFLLEHKADVAAVNNDGELAIDISESDEMEDLLQKEIDSRSINCEDARNLEEQCMLNDARDWYNSGFINDPPHAKTGASALHVAAAKGYMKVMNLLIQAGMEVNIQDYDGWTPLHAAAHWAQREACELLADNYSNMELKNCVGQTPFDVADPDVLRLLEELKKKQNTLQKDNPIIRERINKPPSTPNSRGGRSTNNFNMNHVDIIRTNANSVSNNLANNDRSSITRSSQQDKFHSTREATVKETIKEEKNPSGNLEHESDKESSTDTSESDDLSLPDPLSSPFHTARIYQSSISAKTGRPLDSPGVVVTDESGKEAPGFAPPHPDTSATAAGAKDDAAPWRRPGSLRARPTTSGKLSPSSEDLVTVRRAHSFGSDEKFYAKLAELRQRIRANSMPTLNKDLDSLQDVSKTNLDTLSQTATLPKSYRKHSHGSDLSTFSLPRPGKPRMQTVLESQQLNLDLAPEEKPPLPPKPSPPHHLSKYIISPQPFRRTDDAKLTLFAGSTPLHPSHNTNSASPPPHDPEWRKLSPEEGISKQSPDLRPRSSENLSHSRNNSGSTPLQGQVRRSFVPPVRDEEHEIQRKAHAKRVRETRRSTQGVTLEDLKSAEQLVKKKQQAENAARTTELQQLVISSPGPASPSPALSPAPPGSTATTTVTTTATLVAGSGTAEADKQERRPSWRLRMEASDKNRFTLEDARERLNSLHQGSGSPASDRRQLAASRLDPASVREQRHSIHVLTSSSPTPASHGGETDGAGSGAATPTQLNPIQRKKKPKRRSTGVVNLEMEDPRSEESADENVPVTSSQTTQELKKGNLKSQNGEVDYKKLWEESQSENSRLRTEMSSIRTDLDSTRHQLESAIQASTKNSISDSEKREKKMLEKKLSEMEEELKTLEQLKADNQRLRDENGALIRVISKLSK